ncbi:MAG: sulfotransferase domain-containing protein [Flavobacteriaceae bacterium]
MIWLASYPRSGNTFFRNILFEVYGIQSSVYYLGKKKKLDPEFASFSIVKTHLLPHQLPLDKQSFKSIYLIRDGRDSVVSLAHHRKDIKKTSSNYYKNLIEVILGIGSSFPGGWSRHVKDWGNHSSIIICYEELIKDPIGQVERLRVIMDLPEPKYNKLPTFQSQKKGASFYSIEKKTAKKDQAGLSNNFFRRGVSGSYKDEMPRVIQFLFWLKHQKQMNKFNYYNK